jgi:pilus assembly protein CpaB
VLTALVLAGLLAGVVVWILSSRLRASATNTKTTPIVVAAKDLPAGVPLTAEEVRLADWPASVPLPGSFSKLDQVVGRPLIYAVGAKEPLLERDLAVPGSGLGLAVKIPPGMRATSVRSNEIVGVAGFLYPGSHVDVLGTFTLPGNPTPLTQTILQNVEVLTAGQQIEPDPQGKPQSVNVVTVLLNPADSQKLLLASAQGSIQFVLRSGADEQKVTPTPTRLDQLVTGAAPPPVPKAAARAPRPRIATAPPPKPPEALVMEVIQGEERHVQKF